MEIKRSVEISVEKTRRFVIRQPETNETISCPMCNEPMLTAETAAVLFGLPCRRIYQIVESGAAHFLEVETGAMFVCPSSLNQEIGDQEIGDADAPTTQVVELSADSAAEVQTEEIEIKQNQYETKNLFKDRD